jgi:manganese/zinc/iron transport system substrate-binding protein
MIRLMWGLAFVTLASGCNNGPKGPTAVCTTGMVADVVRNVAGKHFEVVQLMGEGVDPHKYESSPADASALKNATVIFYSGLHLEGQMTTLLEGMAERKPTCVLGDAVDPKRLLRDDESQTVDPHIWFDVELWAQTVDAVRDTLVKVDPEHADEFRENARIYKEKLLDLHGRTQKALAEVPRERRVLVTAHDAFRYFGKAYDIEVHGLQGISTTSEAGLRERARLARFITERRIKAIFVESSVAKESIKALQEDCRAAGHEVKIGGELFSDAMGAEDTPAGTYEGMIDHNVRTIVEALK